MSEENQKMANNPFGNLADAGRSDALVQVEEQRAMQEVQAAMTVAKKFPRDEMQAMDRILKACTRKTLADAALYAFPRGGTLVSGPSIRIAEAIAQNWGNLQFGIRELGQRNGESTVESFCWDLETNVRSTKIFQVKHIRYTRSKGNTPLTDPRDIYEMIANQGARRLRACILSTIPGDVTEAAVKQCEVTQEQSEGAPEEQIGKLIEAFAKYGVDAGMLARRLGHNLDATTRAEIVNLKRVFASIRDGMAGVDSFFERESGANVMSEALDSGKPAADQTPSEAAGAPQAEKPVDDTPETRKSADTQQPEADSGKSGDQEAEKPEETESQDKPPTTTKVCAAYQNAENEDQFAEAVSLQSQLKRKSRFVDEARQAAFDRLMKNQQGEPVGT